MLAAVICTDRKGALETRLANREAHLAYLRESAMVVQAGPFLDPDGRMCGSLVILDVPDLEAARRWAEADPYARAGLFARVRIETWKKVI